LDLRSGNGRGLDLARIACDMHGDDEGTSGELLGRLASVAGSRPESMTCGGLRSIALVGSHGPRPGGLATFTVELGDALTREWPGLEHVVVAVNDRTRAQPLPASVRHAIAPGDVSAYRRAADFLNLQDVDLVAVQYEDGLHGGPGGMYLLGLLRELRMPVVTTLHTIAPAPDRVQRDVLNEIVRRSERLVVTSARGYQLLRELYGVRTEKVDHIPGGGNLPSPAVARAYGRCFERARAEHAQRHWSTVEAAPSLADRMLGVPRIELAHISALTDDAGIQAERPAQDACGVHTLDDNLRALALMAWLEQLGADERWTISVLASRYLSFVVDAFDPERARFRARMDADGEWRGVASEDSHGRALWALGTVAGRARDRGRCHLAAEVFGRALPAVEGFTSPLAIAYVLLGASEYQRSYAADADVNDLQKRLIRRLADELARAGTTEWPWLEEQVGVESARVAQALLVGGDRVGEPQAVALGARALHWLLGGQRGPDGGFVARASGIDADGAPSTLQRPADAAAVGSACLTALRITGEEQWADEASHAYAWFLGANGAQAALYDPRTGACADGVRDDRVAAGQGAEAITAFLLASAEIRAAVGAVADQLPCDLRSLARGTGSHARQVRNGLVEKRDDARAPEHGVARAHTDSERES
jgi:hypothetical protein